MNTTQKVSILVFFTFLSTNLFCMDYASIAKELKAAVTAKDRSLFATIHSFNNSLSEDQKKDILYRLNIFDQQKSRLVCSEWKKIIDRTQHLSSYFALLRNPSLYHTPSKNKARVLLGAVYNNEHFLVETILQCSDKKEFRRIFCNNPYAIVYDPHYFLGYTKDDRMKKIFHPWQYCEPHMFYPNNSEKPLLVELVAASFLGNTERIREIMDIIHRECPNRNNHFLNNNNWDTNTDRALLEIFRIIIDYDDVQSLSILVNSFEPYGGLSINSFFEYILNCYERKSLKSMEVLLSSMPDKIKVVDSWMGKSTIKDHILQHLIAEKDSADIFYNKSVCSLLDKYGTKTSKEILEYKEKVLYYNNLKKVAGGIFLGISVLMLGWFLYTYGHKRSN